MVRGLRAMAGFGSLNLRCLREEFIAESAAAQGGPGFIRFCVTESLFDARRYLIPFRSSLLPQIFCDTLVIGGGVAGARAALAAAEMGEVIVLAKEPLASANASNTAWAQGGVAAAFDAGDTAASHVEDTMVAGAGLCDEPVVSRVVEQGPRFVRELMAWGAKFDSGASGDPSLGLEGGHAHARILHSNGDATGREVARVLTARLRSTANVRVFDGCFALDLITPGIEPGAPVMGAITHHPRFGLQMIWAKSTVLATGGAGMLYRETTNPKVATGDGPALAYRAGASVADMAFVQFHPTCLYIAGAQRWLITEAVRGAGATLIDAEGDRFMLSEHPRAELAPRDVVTRGIVRRLAGRGHSNVYLDCRAVAGFAAKFPGMTKLLASFDLDASKDLIPVHPAAHYAIGGVRVDEAGRTDVPGLFAVGECACSGLHGANRLASNSLLEGLVLGAEVGRAAGARGGGREEHSPTAASAAQGWGATPRTGPIAIVSDIRPPDSAELDLSDVLSSLRAAMWRNCGIERRGPRLVDLQEMLAFWGKYTLDKIFDDVQGWQLQNMLLTAHLMARSAAWREESRGCHWRDEFAGPREEFRVHDVQRRGRADIQRQQVAADMRENQGRAGGAEVPRRARGDSDSVPTAEARAVPS
ncbi:L-aspartate oxidase [soil metagenome]